MNRKLSLLTPTHNSAATIEATLRAVLAQAYRPLEVCVYDEASTDGTLDVVRRTIDSCAPRDVEVVVSSSETNSGPVKAWRVPLLQATGGWCCFVWADDILAADFSSRMMPAAERAVAAGRKLVFSSAEVEIDGRLQPKYSSDAGILSPAEFSFGIFLRRYSLNQINGVYDTAAAREVFDRHVQFENPLGFDYNRFPYGNDVGFLSELSARGGGVEILGDRLVRLVLSSGSMTRSALSRHLWQFRWQYTFAFQRVWRSWARDGEVAAASALVEFATNRLALCELMVHGGLRRIRATHPYRAARSLVEYSRWDWERTRMPLETFRRRVRGLST